MFSKLVLVSLIAFAASAPQHPPQAQYPPGVNPALCPGFPICDNALLHNPQPHWAAPPPQPHWQHAPQPHWNPAPAPHWGAPALPGPSSNHLPAAADKYPAGVSPHSCPNYPFCDVNAGHNHAAAPPLPGFTERLYPAGVSPHECPNFPYCS